jgi:hypothetical protein
MYHRTCLSRIVVNSGPQNHSTFSTLEMLSLQYKKSMIIMDDQSRNNTTTNTQHARVAGRVAAGLEQPVTIKKNGARHVSLMVVTIFK